VICESLLLIRQEIPKKSRASHGGTTILVAAVGLPEDHPEIALKDLQKTRACTGRHAS